MTEPTPTRAFTQEQVELLVAAAFRRGHKYATQGGETTNESSGSFAAGFVESSVHALGYGRTDRRENCNADASE